jgi:glycerophosphoryl diester phosphodiesterase
MTILYLIIVLIVIFMMTTIPTRKGKNMSWMKGVSAHRGWFLENQSVAENSMSAFRQALEKNIDIELDIQMTADRKLIVFHDSNLQRMCQVNISVADATYDEIKQYTFYNSDEIIPTLQEVLAEIDGKVNVFIEVKPTDFVDEVCQQVVLHLDHYKGNFAICSFNPLVLMWLRKNRPNYIRGQNIQFFLFDKRQSLINRVLLTINGYNIFTRADYISVHFDIVMFFTWMRIFKGFLSCWAVSNETDYRQLKKKVDHLIIEFIEYD